MKSLPAYRHPDRHYECHTIDKSKRCKNIDHPVFTGYRTFSMINTIKASKTNKNIRLIYRRTGLLISPMRSSSLPNAIILPAKETPPIVNPRRMASASPFSILDACLQKLPAFSEFHQGDQGSTSPAHPIEH